MSAATHDRFGETAARQLAKTFRLVDLWDQRTNALAPEPAVGSSLRKDDEACGPYQLSHAAYGALVTAVDHFGALRGLVRTARLMPPAPRTRSYAQRLRTPRQQCG